MASRSRRLTGTWVVALTLVAGGDATAQTEPLTVAVTLVNLAEIPTEDLGPAQQQAAKAFEAIGLRICWLSEGMESAPKPTGFLQLRLTLLSRQMTDHMIAAGRGKHDTLGLAVAPSNMAYVFSSRILLLASARGTAFHRMLGVVMAHEIGHILLPGRPHSASGIMRANLLDRSTQPEAFTSDQAALIRSRVEAAGSGSVGGSGCSRLTHR